MRRISTLQVFAFATGLLLTQWLAVVHATEHQLSNQPDRATCQLCAYAHASAPVHSPPALPQPVSFHQVPTLTAESAPCLVRRYTLPPSRAPPR